MVERNALQGAEAENMGQLHGPGPGARQPKRRGEGARNEARSLDLRLYVVLDTGAAGDRSLAEVAREAIAGGATMLQVRAKSETTRCILELSRAVISVARPAGVPVVVNDRADIAVAADADGVHVGEDDLPVAAARRIMGPRAIVGFSTARVALAQAAAAGGADYVGTGDVYGTSSKPDADRPIGLSGLAAVVRGVEVPVVAIGGVGPGRAAEAVRSGAAGIAVISAVVAADDIMRAASRLRQEVDRALGSEPHT